MKIKTFLQAAALATVLATPAAADDRAIEALINSGPVTTTIPLPDPSHIPVIFGKDIKWTGEPGQQQARLFGDPSKPGLYGILYKWGPGHYSRPHSHSKERYIYVVSGTWWVSSSDTFDPSKTYPVPAGSYVRDIPNTVHWDGAKDDTAILMLVGEGPMETTPHR